MNSLSSQHSLAFYGKAASLQPWLSACCVQGPGIVPWGPVMGVKGVQTCTSECP